MRILKITLKNINSLRGEHVVDFTSSPLRDAGIFGIVGPMGSGKSTLLDTITLALFGRVPRLGTITKTTLEKSGAILTRHQKDCLAEVNYACKNGVFISRWSVSKTRNDTFRDIEIKVFNESGDQLSDNVRDAVGVNVANIGLDYDQFVKSILLCQGEFAKFLQSNKNDRALLLEKITGIHAFRRIGRKAFQEYNRRKLELDNKEQVLTDIARNLLAEDIRNQLEQEIAGLAVRMSTEEKKLDEAKKKLLQKNSLLQLKERIGEQEKRKQQASTALQIFEQAHGGKMLHYEKLFVYRDQLAEHQRLAAALKDAVGKMQLFRQQLSKADDDIGKMVQELRKWVGEEVSASDYVQHLRAFRDKVRDAASARDERRRALLACQGRLSNLLNQPAFQFEKSLFKKDYSNEQLLGKLRARRDEEAVAFRKAVDTYGFDVHHLESARSSVTVAIADLGQLKGEVRSYKGQLEQVKLCTARIADLEVRLKAFDMQGLMKMLDSALEVREKAEQERDRLLAAENLVELRKSLRDGEPCPLCGSEHHPYLHQFAENVLHAGGELDKARQWHNKCKKAYDDGVLQMTQLENSLGTERDNLKRYEVEKARISALVDGLKKKVGIDKVQSEEKVQELIELQKIRLQALESCIRYSQWEPQAAQVEQAVDEYDGLSAELSILNAELAKIYSGSDLEKDCAEREQAMTDALDAKRLAVQQLMQTEKQQQSDQKQLQRLSSALMDPLLSAGYISIDEARANLMEEVEHRSLSEQKGKIIQELTGSSEQLEQLGSQWHELSNGDDPAVSVEQQQASVSRLETEIKGLRDEWKNRHGSLQGDDKLRKQLGSYEEERRLMQVALTPWDLLNRLIGDKTGNKFNNIAQDLTLEHLLILANLRLGKLHSRYKILPPSADDDLRVEDNYMGNEVRTIRSLSGGETFVISLALALGLSDLAAKDIRIDSLFVDEGFGSLDPETLEEAMSTLEQLQSESNKTVGIISHVESLKERIYTQIRLTKSNSGFSTITIFPENNADEQKS